MALDAAKYGASKFEIEAVYTRAVYERLHGDPQLEDAALVAYERAASGEWTFDRGCCEISYRELYLQTWTSRPDPLVAGFVILQFEAAAKSGQLCRLSFEAEHAASADRSPEDNRALLARVSGPITATSFEGVVDGGMRYLGDPDVRPPFDAPRLLPLDIGITEPWALMFHASRSDGFVRWPNGSTHLYAFLFAPGLFSPTTGNSR
jgi:hypothetical protein